MWGPKHEKCESHESCIGIAGFLAWGCQKESVVYEVYKMVEV